MIGKGDNAAYALTDEFFTRTLLKQYSWGGGTKKGYPPKLSFKKYEYVFKFFYSLVKKADPLYSTVQMQSYFQNKLLPNSGRRIGPIIRAPRAKCRAKLVPTDKKKRGRTTAAAKKFFENFQPMDEDDGQIDDEMEEKFVHKIAFTANEVLVEKQVLENDANIKATADADASQLPAFVLSFAHELPAKTPTSPSKIRCNDLDATAERVISIDPLPLLTHSINNNKGGNFEFVSHSLTSGNDDGNGGDTLMHKIVNETEIVNRIPQEVEIITSGRDPLMNDATETVGLNDSSGSSGNGNSHDDDTALDSNDDDEEMDPENIDDGNDENDELDDDEILDQKQIGVSSLFRNK